MGDHDCCRVPAARGGGVGGGLVQLGCEFVATGEKRNVGSHGKSRRVWSGLQLLRSPEWRSIYRWDVVHEVRKSSEQ